MFSRLINWVLEQFGLKPVVGFSLLFLAVGSAAYAFAEAIKPVEFGLLFPLIFYALLFSWLLAQSRIRGWAGAILLVILGLVLPLVRVAELTGPLFALVRVFFNTLWQILNLNPGEVLDLANLSFAYSQVNGFFSVVITALFDWVQSVRDGLPLANDIAIQLLWSVLLWVLSCWAGWWLRRWNQPLVALLPIGTFSAAILAYTWSDTIVFGPMLFGALLLFAFVNYDRSESSWKAANMDYPEDLPKEFSATAVVLVFGLVVVALTLPSISFQSIIDRVSQITEPQIEQAEPVIESFGLEQSSIPRGDIGRALRGGLPRFHLMGSGPELSEQIVMTVRLTGGVPQVAESDLRLPLYWRSLTYNEYFGFGWRSSDVVIRTYQAGEEVISTASPYHQVIQQDFRMAQGETRFLYAAGDILTADDVFKIAYRPTPRYTEIFDAHGDFFGASIEQNAFRVQSLIPVVSEPVLRQAGVDYPGWVVERYLPLPENIPGRVFQLASELTAADPTPYDKVRTLEGYLRGFEYTLDVDLPPVRSDLVDYFLFNLQKGYCDYYASAMVVMARSLGIPARLAIGYVRGTYDDVNNRYIVSEAEAHSWVEVYFPGIGWVPFEPTAGRAAITRFESEEEVQQATEQDRDIGSLLRWRERLGLDWNLSRALGFAAAGMLLFSLGFYFVDQVRLERMSAVEATNELYQRLYRHGRRVGVATYRIQTPLEFSSKLARQLQSLSGYPILRKPMQRAIEQLHDFTRLYTLVRYSPLTLGMEDRKAVIRLWKGLRRRLTLARLGWIAARFRRRTSRKRRDGTGQVSDRGSGKSGSGRPDSTNRSPARSEADHATSTVDKIQNNPRISPPQDGDSTARGL